jgi:tetratricopeptide (TPR) repeat protein
MKIDKYISYIILCSYLILIIFGIITLFNPDWLIKISEYGRKTEANTPFDYANKLMYEGNFELAITNYNESLNIDKDNRNTYGNLSIAYTKIGNFEMAESCLKEVERLSEGLDSTALFIHYLSHADLELAKSEKLNFQGLNPTINLENALNYYHQAINLMPFDISIRYKYCSIAMMLNNDSIAIETYEETLAIDQKIETFYFASLYDEYLTFVINIDDENAVLLSAIINTDKEIDWNRYDTISFKLNSKNQKQTANAYLNLGELFYRNKDFKQADIAFNNCIKINPGLINKPTIIKERYEF